jgi:hypothetical protein
MDADREEAAANPESCDLSGGASGVGSNNEGCFEPRPNMFANEFFLAPMPLDEDAIPGIDCPNLYSALEPPPSVPDPPIPCASTEDFPHVPPRIPTHLESKTAGAMTIPTPSTRAIPLIKTIIFDGSSHRNSVVDEDAALSCDESPSFSNLPLAANLCGENFLNPPSIQDVFDTTALNARRNDDSTSNATAALRYESKHSRSFSSENMVSANDLGTMKPNIFALAIA